MRRIGSGDLSERRCEDERVESLQTPQHGKPSAPALAQKAGGSAYAGLTGVLNAQLRQPQCRYSVLAHLQGHGPGRDGVASRRRVSGPSATRLTPTPTPSPSGTGTPTPTPSPGNAQLKAQLIAQADAEYQAAQAALRAANLTEYGKQIDALGKTLARLKALP